MAGGQGQGRRGNRVGGWLQRAVPCRPARSTLQPPLPCTRRAAPGRQAEASLCELRRGGQRVPRRRELRQQLHHQRRLLELGVSGLPAADAGGGGVVQDACEGAGVAVHKVDRLLPHRAAAGQRRHQRQHQAQQRRQQLVQPRAQ